MSLPSHLWCWLVRFASAADFAAVVKVSRSLLNDCEVKALSQYYAFVCGFVRNIPIDEIFILRKERAVCQNVIVDWKRFWQLNMQARVAPDVWVRVLDVDLRMPLSKNYPWLSANAVTLLGELAKVIYGRRLRLRALQWSGRPGPVVDRQLVAADHLMLEMAPQNSHGWSLPPHAIHCDSSSVDGVMLGSMAIRSPLCDAGTSGKEQEQVHGQELPEQQQRSSRQRPAQANGQASEQVEQQHRWVRQLRSHKQQALLRVLATKHDGKSSLLEEQHGELWLALDLSVATLGSLFKLVAKAVRKGVYGWTAASPPTQLALLDIQYVTGTDTRWTRRSKSMLLRELGWSHSETVMLEIQDLREEKCSNDSDSESSCTALVLIRREEESFDNLKIKTADSTDADSTDKDPGKASGDAGTVLTLCADNDTAATSATRRPQCWWTDDGHVPHLPCQSRLCHAAGHAALLGGKRDLAADMVEICGEGSGREENAPTPSLDRECACAADRVPAGESAVGAQGSDTEHMVPHYQPRVLFNTSQTRQFEFHPSLPQVLLVGDRSGGVNVIDTEGHQEARQPLVVDSSPVLGLSWMRRHPQSAVCGSASSGQIRFLRYDADAQPGGPVLKHVHAAEEFPRLSSLSVNCTDDFLLASGHNTDLAVYDIHTGKVLYRALEVHSHFINVSRFTHHSPHIFATASCDYTCKVWDLRQRLIHDRPIKSLNTGGCNVMCTYSPDDRYLLCSGLDTRIAQFEMPSFKLFPEKFSLRPAVHEARFRRSMYLAAGRHFVTAATDESHVSILSAKGKNLGVIDFRGLLGQESLTAQRLLKPKEMTVASYMHLQSRSMVDRQVAWEDSPLLRGEVRPEPSDHGPLTLDAEFVQSVRTHPTIENCFGVLLSNYNTDPQSYIALVHIDPEYSRAS
eukprot:gnl/TRDRNA2_/TRDRNA2_82612_c0_seq1.p1 gnl/TRDRNA2_/TRDRNA2_82612_c0~~gnl/TRDRNA2_/TRDRNA2_82612_c0_seq1.p1  ORF type:complete len:911 (+),score=139.70 gnl/TRDRNA2_/TRDRNA2_82612_c0_seq1:124-2856(+)